MPDRLLALAVAATPSPAPSPSNTAPAGLDPNKVSPGIEGFVTILVLVIITVVLIRSLVGRIRRIRYRAERTGELAEAPRLPEAQPSPRPVRAPRSARPLGPGRAGAIRDVPERGRQDDSQHLQ